MATLIVTSIMKNSKSYYRYRQPLLQVAILLTGEDSCHMTHHCAIGNPDYISRFRIPYLFDLRFR